MRTIKKMISYLFISFSIVVNAQIDKESNFYFPVEGKLTEDLSKDYRVGKKNDRRGNQRLQRAIDLISKQGGGTIIIPKGEYVFGGIQLKSNVNIKIDKDAVLKLKSARKGTTIFSLGEKNEPPVKNVSITCLQEGERYQVDFTDIDESAAVFALSNVENFLISGFHVEDDYSKFSAIRMGIDEYNGKIYYPVNGIIKNASTNNSHYGYGLLQAQAAKNVLFKNLSGVGGATVRLETGAKKVNDLQQGGVFDAVVRDVSCKNGNSAFMASPHAMHNGKVDVDGVYAESCGFAARIENGFIAKKYIQSSRVTVGTFQSITVRNIKAIYGNKAQLKGKHFKYMPCELRSQIKPSSKHMDRVAGKAAMSIGPAICPVLFIAKYPVFLSEVESEGFICEDILKKDAADNCRGSFKKKKKKKVI